MYKKKISHYLDWDALTHADDYLVFSENIGTHISIDEVSLSKGELYNFVTNKAAKSLPPLVWKKKKYRGLHKRYA